MMMNEVKKVNDFDNPAIYLREYIFFAEKWEFVEIIELSHFGSRSKRLIKRLGSS